jgi:16S rRNA (guanine527-N7)-methyltransferase
MPDISSTSPLNEVKAVNLIESARIMGVVLSPGQVAQFDTYCRELIAWNKRTNLTRITAETDIYVKHFLDSLSCLAATPALPSTLIDVGTGPGLPGLALKIAQPHIKLTLVESAQKKVDFLRHIVQRLDLKQVVILPNRAEEVGQNPEHRERYHLAVARAVAPLAVLAEYLLPLLHIGGTMLAQKGGDPSDEVTAAARVINLLGGRHHQTLPVSVPHLEANRHLVVVKKINPTPEQYPRRPGIPAKKPIF